MLRKQILLVKDLFNQTMFLPQFMRLLLQIYLQLHITTLLFFLQIQQMHEKLRAIMVHLDRDLVHLILGASLLRRWSQRPYKISTCTQIKEGNLHLLKREALDLKKVLPLGSKATMKHLRTNTSWKISYSGR